MVLRFESHEARSVLEALVIPVCEDQAIHDHPEIAAAVARAREYPEFSGKSDQELIWFDSPPIPAKRLIFRGLGKFETLKLESFRAMAGKASRAGVKKDLSGISLAVPSARRCGQDPETLLEALAEGAVLGNHCFDRYKEKPEHSPLGRIGLWTDPEAANRYPDLPDRVETICAGTVLAREWVNTPANHKRPHRLARELAELAESEGLTVQVLGEESLKAKGFGAMLAVAQGSDSPPALLILEHLPRAGEAPTMLVGKGVTFDSGGLNLKPGGSMLGMKADMAGGAAVAATLITAARLGLDQNLVGLVPLVENMPSGRAIRPGDIVKSHAGKTVEIGNTDAEGRLILIDALAYGAEQYEPGLMIDLATLTGACVVALGDKLAGVFSPDPSLADAIAAAGKKTHERCWPMPLPDDYKELVKSDFADIANLPSTRMGGAISAALFLSEFVGKRRWAHIDIAGPAYLKEESDYCGPGASGFGVRLLCELLRKR